MNPLPENTIQEMLLQFADRCGPESSFCPSEVARALSEEWRPLMPLVRQEANALVASGALRCTQAGAEISPLEARGAIRLAKK